MAQRLQGLILVLEHRFYGKSLPFDLESYTLENMRLLNSEQALKDLAYFTEQVISQKLHKVANNPWIAIGGSYPGALSAWYRYKYPHLTIGAIASSAVINAIVDFK
jgi:pimeloyl-ACP methyl ester carboxylesterase